MRTQSENKRRVCKPKQKKAGVGVLMQTSYLRHEKIFSKDLVSIKKKQCFKGM